MADLIAIGYPDETTAIEAAHEAEHLAEDLIIQPDALAATAIMVGSIDKRPWSDVGLGRTAARARLMVMGFFVGGATNGFTCVALLAVGLLQFDSVAGGASWGMFWGFLFGLLFLVPFFGLAIGAGLGALMGKLEKSGIDKQFMKQVRDMLKPGTSALFLVVEKVTPDKAVAALSKYGGTVLKTSLSEEAQNELQKALHGGAAREPVPASV